MKLDNEPRLAPGPGLFASLIDWARSVARSVNALYDAIGSIRAGATPIGDVLDGPAFSAYRSTDQTGLTINAFNDVVFNAELFDTAGAFNTTTGRFTPKVPGYYQVDATVTLEATGGVFGNVQIQINKNGVAAKRLEVSVASNATVWQASGGGLIQMNGSTDYLSVTCYNAGATGVSYDGIATGEVTFFSGFLARRA